ncbi:Ent-kaurene synthase [Nemania sp. FL0916]|nr:Ent-kaurene synthase [Nemania sp. FL0916]
MPTVSDQPEPKSSLSVLKNAKRIVRYVAERCSQPNDFGSFDISIYDTAWLAMIQDPVVPGCWLFPESYSYLLIHQTENGMWPTHGLPMNGILNTLAALLALVKHQKSDTISNNMGNHDPIEAHDVLKRVEKARGALQSALNDCDMNQLLNVGCKMLVPGLLRQLGEEGVVFEFESQSTLATMYQQALAKFDSDDLVFTQPTTLIDSLEAFVDVVDFSLLRNYCSAERGIMGSPASTAAYLVGSPERDARAQAYLENVVRKFGSCGGVPSGFPTLAFEMSWIISTLFSSNFIVEDFRDCNFHAVTQYLRKVISDQGNLHGSVPTCLTDVDDTARCMLALTLLDAHIDQAALINELEERVNHFESYKFKSTTCVSANCSILLMLLTSPNVDQYISQIEKALTLICRCWNAKILQNEKNVTAEHTCMLLTYAMYQLLRVYAQGSLRNVSVDVIETEVPIILIQLLGRTLSEHKGNGSWGDSVERTSFGVLLISYALKLPWPSSIRGHAKAAFFQAKAYLEAHSNEGATGDLIWINKVTYRLPTLAETYCLAAINSSIEEQSWTPEVEQIFGMDANKMNKLASFFGRLPLLQNLLEATMTFAIHEAAMYFKRLKQVRLDIFPRDDMAVSTDKYLQYIPVAWTTINATNGFILSGDEMWEMIVLSMLNYQADEYMESVVARLAETSSQDLAAMIKSEVRNGEPEAKTQVVSSPIKPDRDLSPTPSDFEDIAIVVSKYIRHVKLHPALMQSPKSAQIHVTQELEKFLLAHMAHNSDSARLRKHRQSQGSALVDWHDQVPYYDWARTTGANDTSCPYSFAFFCCLISSDESHCLVSMEQKYLAREMCLHLATLCRQYNDFGSARRDDQEDNLNSLHFPEFTDEDGRGMSCQKTAENTGREDYLEKANVLLMKVAGIERALMQVCWDALSSGLNKEVRAKLKAFIDITDLFGQIYVARDIASKVKR